MGYACPVCGTPEVDGRHLANHVAFTALTGDSAHEEWLDERVPEWGDLGEDELAERVVPHADASDVADVFDDGGGHDHDHGTGGRPDVGTSTPPAPDLDEETADVLAEAREYTRQMAERRERSQGSQRREGGQGSEGNQGSQRRERSQGSEGNQGSQESESSESDAIDGDANGADGADETE